MTHFLCPWMRVGLLPLAVLFASFTAGCHSDPGPGRRGGPAGARAKPPAPMAGQDTFFDGQILAEIHVGTDGMPDAAPEGSGPGGESEGRRRRGGGSGRVSVAGGTGGFGGNVAGGVPFGEGGRPARDFSGAPGPRPMLGGGRPVMIHLRFTNHGTTAVELHITDFLSPLGNFVVRPEKLTLEPGQSLETEPMTSQLAGAFSEVTATLALRLDGRAEKRSFSLKALATPAAQP